MKIAIVEPVGGHGGMDYYDYGLAYGLGANDIEVLYYTCDKTEIRDFPNVFTIISFVKLWDVSFFRKVYRYLKGHLESFKDSKKKGVKIIHLHFFTFRLIDYLVILIAKSMKFTIVATIHDISSFDKSASRIFEKRSYKLIDGIIVHNKSSLNDLKKKNVKIKRIDVIAHGNYKPFISEILLKEKTDRFTLLFFGQIKKVKGLDVLLNAIKKIKDKGYDGVELIIAGKVWKSDLDSYVNLVNVLGIKDMVRTDFRYIPDEEVASFYSKADLVILPYTEIYQSGVVLLTMSYGKPVLCSDLEAFKEVVIEGETGFLFENKNEFDLADKIINVMERPELLQSVIDNSKLLMDTQYDWVNIGRKTKEFYKSVLR